MFPNQLVEFSLATYDVIIVAVAVYMCCGAKRRGQVVRAEVVWVVIGVLVAMVVMCVAGYGDSRTSGYVVWW